MLVLTVFTGVMGSAQAQTAGQPLDLGTLSTNVQQETDFSSTTGHSFADIFNFTIDANDRTLNSSAVNFTSDGIEASGTHLSNLKIELFSGFDTGDTFLDQVLSVDGGQLGGGFRFQVAANPKPADWRLLVCGLLVMAFIARRKTRLVAG